MSAVCVFSQDLQFHYFVICETNLVACFPSSQTAIENYKIRTKMNRENSIEKEYFYKRIKQFRSVILTFSKVSFPNKYFIIIGD